MTHANGSAEEPIIIKKYANRRLYDTSTSAYVTLEHLSTLVRDGKEFQVQDAKTGADLTRAVLAQIIFDQENRKEGVLPVSFLRQLIQFYGDSLQTMLPQYLELSMKNYSSQQEKWREFMTAPLGDENKAKAWDELTRKNMEMFEESMRLFSPFVPKPGAAVPGVPGAEAKPVPETAVQAGAEAIQTMQKQMAEMQRQLAKLAGMGMPTPEPKKE